MSHVWPQSSGPAAGASMGLGVGLAAGVSLWQCLGQMDCPLTHTNTAEDSGCDSWMGEEHKSDGAPLGLIRAFILFVLSKPWGDFPADGTALTPFPAAVSYSLGLAGCSMQLVATSCNFFFS